MLCLLPGDLWKPDGGQLPAMGVEVFSTASVYLNSLDNRALFYFFLIFIKKIFFAPGHLSI